MICNLSSTYSSNYSGILFIIVDSLVFTKVIFLYIFYADSHNIIRYMNTCVFSFFLCLFSNIDVPLLLLY